MYIYIYIYIHISHCKTPVELYRAVRVALSEKEGTDKRENEPQAMLAKERGTLVKHCSFSPPRGFVVPRFWGIA